MADGGGDWVAWAEAQVAAVAAAGRLREIRELDGPPSGTFASNDYLGLSQHPAVVAAAQEAVARWGVGSGAARLTVGSRSIHTQLEEALADWKETEAAVLFPTGYAANLGVLGALGRGNGLRILSDGLNHASIVDGCRLSGAAVDVYRHADAGHAADLLGGAGGGDGAGAGAAGRRTVLVTETVFSMDGDVAPVAELAALCRDSGTLLVLDEAHAVLGPQPALDGVECLRVGTLSKTLGSMGGFVAGPRPMIDLLINRARPFIFTTAAAPVLAAAALAALGVLRSAEGEALVNRLRAVVDRVSPGHPSAVIPLVIGDEDDAVAVSRALAERGVVVPAIRPPTVPVGTARLRITLSAAHADAQVDHLLDSLRAVGHPLG